MKITSLFAGVGGVGLGLVVSSAIPACVSYSPDLGHCINQTGDEFCREKYGGEKAFCQEGTCEPKPDDGCVATRPADDACYSPCGEGKTLADDPDQECEGVADTGTESSTLTGTVSETTPSTSGDPTTMSSMSMSASETETDTTATTEPTTTGPSGCVSSSECLDPGAPICEDMMCVACTDARDGDAACAEKDAEAPACGDDGACVQCTPNNPSVCAEETPVCDEGSSSCVGCTYHEQCAGSACDMATGACFDADGCVVEVDGDGGADSMTIGGAIADGCVVVVHELDGELPYLENLNVSGLTVALLSAPGESPVVQGTGGDASLSVVGNANVYVQGLTFSLNGTAEGVAVDGASVWLDRSRVVQNTGGGVTVMGGGLVTLRNCFVGGNGNQFAADSGIEVASSEVRILYTSVVANDGNGADSLRCTDATGYARNSILLGSDPSSIDCLGVSLETNAVDEAAAGNENVGPLNPSWFGGLPNNLSLTAAGELVFGDVAVWMTGDPEVDIDGGARPNVEGTADVAGADIP